MEAVPETEALRSEKQKGNPSNNQIPEKKQKTEKHCILCQKYGGHSDLHNTSDCKKYDKDGTLKSGWSKKPDVKASRKS